MANSGEVDPTTQSLDTILDEIWGDLDENRIASAAAQNR